MAPAEVRQFVSTFQYEEAISPPFLARNFYANSSQGIIEEVVTIDFAISDITYCTERREIGQAFGQAIVRPDGVAAKLAWFGV
jgi:hypothetical protein